MFELSVACKYLIPRWRQLSVSIISMISILVISLVVWLILVFFSVTNGLENNWVEKLIALTAPVRMTPTKAYYDSYYYQIDSISEASDYTYKSLREKLAAAGADPYDPDFDEEAPVQWPSPDHSTEGNLKDIVKLAADAAHSLGVAGLSVSPYETSMGNLRLTLVRDGGLRTSMNHSAYLGSFDPENSDLKKTLQVVDGDDLSNILEMLSRTEGASPKQFQEKVRGLLQNAKVTHLKPLPGWRVPLHLYPEEGTLEVAAILRQGRVYQMFAQPTAIEGLEIVRAPLKFDHRQPFIILGGKEIPAKTAPLFVSGSLEIPAELNEKSLARAENSGDLRFKVKLDLQDAVFQGEVPYQGLKIAKADILLSSKDDGRMVLPSDDGADGILLPKNFREAGVLAGDRGHLTYYSPTTSSMQEQQIPVYVAGFYDQGVIPIGGKLVWARPEVVSMVSSAFDLSRGGMETGINVRFPDSGKADDVKEALQSALKKAGIGQYWKVETFREYPYTKDLLQQLRSEKNLFSLISIVIIIVACSNIISMLIILVNDKKTEIGILRSMGASSKSIAAIFGLCGMVMGLLGSVIGIALAALTLKNIHLLINLISHLQGHELFNSHFFGDVIPNNISGEALSFVLLATVLISLISGIIPAIKASLMRPSAILRSE